MMPRIKSGATVTLEPLSIHDPEMDRAVLVKVRGTVYLHLVKASRGSGDSKQYLIGNNHGGINGWASRANVYGKVTHVEQP